MILYQVNFIALIQSSYKNYTIFALTTKYSVVLFHRNLRDKATGHLFIVQSQWNSLVLNWQVLHRFGYCCNSVQSNERHRENIFQRQMHKGLPSTRLRNIC